jgi:hypothetical protein
VKVALIEEEVADQAVRSAELRRALEARGHRVARRVIPEAEFADAEQARYALRRRVARRLSGAPTLPQGWEIVAERIARWIEGEEPDLALARGPRAALAALPAGRTRFAVDLEDVATLRLALRWAVDGPDLEATHRREAAVLERAMVVAVPHRDMGRLLSETFPAVATLEDRLAVVPDGITPGEAPVVARDGVLVCLHPVFHADDPLLLAALRGRLPRPLRRLGDPGTAVSFLPPPPPELTAGEAVSFGLVSRLADRRSRVCGRNVGRLLERGIPVLAPRWLCVDPAAEAAIARYEEASFEQDLEAAFVRIDELREAAASIRLPWEAVLAPWLERLGA